MKKLLTGLLVLGSISAFAGSLENRASGERVDFELNRDTQILNILSSSPLLQNKKINLTVIKKKKSSIDLIGANNWATEEVYGRDGEGAFSDVVGGDTGLIVFSFIVPIMNIPRVGATVFDLVALPIKAPFKLLKNMKYNRDFKKLQKSINGSDIITVSNSRFERILGLLSRI